MTCWLRSGSGNDSGDDNDHFVYIYIHTYIEYIHDVFVVNDLLVAGPGPARLPRSMCCTWVSWQRWIMSWGAWTKQGVFEGLRV